MLSTIFAFCNACLAQTGGQGVFRFLNLPNSAKVAALGNALPMQTDASFDETFKNPSLITQRHQNTLSLNYNNYVSDINFGTIQYGLTVKKDETLSLGLMHINYGSFDEYDATASPTGAKFTAGDYLLNVGYAKHWKNKIYYGANAKLIYGSYDVYKSLAVATDLAVTYKDTSSNVATGIVFKNIGYQLSTFDQKRENLPFQIAVSFSKKLRFAPFRYHITYNDLQTFNLNYTTPNADGEVDLVTGETKNSSSNFASKLSKHFIFGTEILISPSFNLQAGYNLQQREELMVNGMSGLSGLSLGFTLNLKKLSFGYAHSTLNVAGSSNYFSLTLNPSFLNFVK